MTATGVAAPPLYEWFAASMRSWPDEVALEVDDVRLTYDELGRAAGGLAGELVARLGRRPKRVALLTERSTLSYVGYLAALRLGATVVPLGSAAPPARNAAICTRAGTELILVDGHAGPTEVSDLSGVPGLPVPDPLGAADGAAGELPAAQPDPDDVAYILFTSGSTGEPKGIPISHRAIAAYLRHNVSATEAGPGCRFSRTFDLTFDPSLLDLFVCWGSGATLVNATKSDLMDPVEYVSAKQITHWCSVPSLITIADRQGGLPAGSMPTLRRSQFGGEPLTYEQARAWRRAAPASTIENLYGPTELTVACVSYRLSADQDAWPHSGNGTVPIGRTYPHLEHLLLGENGPTDREGELCIRGPQRFAGYLDPNDNAGRFCDIDGRVWTEREPPPPEYWYRTGDRVAVRDGLLVHLGRADSQVKIRGHRLEVSEVEAVMRHCPGVREAVVLAVPDRTGQLELAAVHTGECADPQQVTDFVAARLPGYMVPARCRHLPALPLSPTGKIDRLRLARRLTRPAGSKR